MTLTRKAYGTPVIEQKAGNWRFWSSEMLHSHRTNASQNFKDHGTFWTPKTTCLMTQHHNAKDLNLQLLSYKNLVSYKLATTYWSYGLT